MIKIVDLVYCILRIFDPPPPAMLPMPVGGASSNPALLSVYLSPVISSWRQRRERERESKLKRKDEAPGTAR